MGISWLVAKACGVVILVALFMAAVVHGPRVLAGGQNAQVSPASPADATCSVVGKTWKVTLSRSGFQPATINARLCDKLEITNTTASNFVVSLGPHEHHVAYAGLSSQTVRPASAVTSTLRLRGAFNLHNHAGGGRSFGLTVR